MSNPFTGDQVDLDEAQPNEQINFSFGMTSNVQQGTYKSSQRSIRRHLKQVARGHPLKKETNTPDIPPGFEILNNQQLQHPPGFERIADQSKAHQKTWTRLERQEPISLKKEVATDPREQNPNSAKKKRGNTAVFGTTNQSTEKGEQLMVPKNHYYT